MALWKLSRYFADIVARRMIAGPMGASRLERSIKGGPPLPAAAETDPNLSTREKAGVAENECRASGNAADPSPIQYDLPENQSARTNVLHSSNGSSPAKLPLCGTAPEQCNSIGGVVNGTDSMADRLSRAAWGNAARRGVVLELPATSDVFKRLAENYAYKNSCSWKGLDNDQLNDIVPGHPI